MTKSLLLSILVLAGCAMAAQDHSATTPAALPATLTAESKTDDILDACVLLLTAQRIRDRQAIAIPDPAPRDARGLKMAIHY